MADRLGWALRNLTAANGLNSAVVVNAGVSLKELEALKSPPTSKPTTPKPSATPPPPVVAAPLAIAAAASANPKSFAESRRALTGNGAGKVAPPPALALGGGPASAPGSARGTTNADVPTAAPTAPPAARKPPKPVKAKDRSLTGRLGGKATDGKAAKAGWLSARGQAEEQGSPEVEAKAFAGIGLMNWSRGRAP